jgi:hypothetical protein
MHPHGVDIGAVQQRLVGGRIIGPDPLDQLVLTQETRTRGGAGGGRRPGGSGGRLLRRVNGRGDLGRLDNEGF